MAGRDVAVSLGVCTDANLGGFSVELHELCTTYVRITQGASFKAHIYGTCVSVSVCICVCVCDCEYVCMCVYSCADVPHLHLLYCCSVIPVLAHQVLS